MVVARQRLDLVDIRRHRRLLGEEEAPTPRRVAHRRTQHLDAFGRRQRLDRPPVSANNFSAKSRIARMMLRGQFSPIKGRPRPEDGVSEPPR